MSNLIRMVYVSTSTNPVNEQGSGVHKDVGRILLQARKNNPPKQIGGVLYCSNNYFFQCLEGEQHHVNQVFQKILQDPRHKDIQTISVKQIDQRLFANWSMKYVALEDRVTDLLAENGFDSFQPYAFNDDMIDKMLGVFNTSTDRTSVPDQNYAKNSGRKSSGFLGRLFQRFKQAA